MNGQRPEARILGAAPETTTETTTETSAATGVGADGSTVEHTQEQAVAAAGQATAAEAAAGRHPAHSKIDEIEAALNTMGSYVVSQTAQLISELRSLI